jgi:endonuclease/exonuclease/phosphatase family metal-dependent hydrolase/murein DD-endopeptidase MepM/ murein hydrolase activator NlpD
MSTKSKVLTLTGVLAALGLSVMLMPVLFLAALGGGGGAGGCTPAAAITYSGPSVGDLTPIQMQRAASVVSQGRQMGISDQGIVIALATASQESGFRVYANDGKGSDLASDQQGIAASLNIPHDVVGTDHGSLGVFQQQWPWWGTMNELMDPAPSARLFYTALLKVPGWENLSVTVAAQRVQSSAYPDAYADDEPIARQLLEAITGSGAGGGAENVNDEAGTIADTMLNAAEGGSDVELINNVYVGGYTDCVTGAAVAGGGSVVFPLPADSGYVNQNNFGQTGTAWSSFHTGNDFSVGCGTPVLAATTGTVEYDDSQASWAGPNFVRISTGSPGALATWYAHMESRTVEAGTTVTAGQQIGTVGNLGNSGGCHLHFEVHPTGGRIYDDPIDPVPWLASNVGTEIVVPVNATTGTESGRLGRNAPSNQESPDGKGGGSVSAGATGQTVTLAQANIPRRSGMDGFRASMPKVLSTEPDFVTLNEMFGRSLSQIEAAAVGYRGYRDPSPDPGPGGIEASDSVVLWKTANWDFVAGGRVKLLVNVEPTKHGPVTRSRYAVWATLRSKAGGGVVSVISTHMPVNPGRYGPNQPLRQRQYQQGMQELIQLMQQLSGDGQVLVGGDFNVHGAKGTGVHAQGDEPWAAPQMMSGAGYQWYSRDLDYIFYPAGAAVSNTTSGSMVSDHPWISAQITLAAGSTITAPPTSPDSLTVLTYNVDHGVIAQGAGGVSALAYEIAATGANVVALQDVDRLGAGETHEELSANLRELSQQLRMQFAYSVNTNGDGQSVLDNAILTKFPIVDAENTDLTGSDDGDANPRGLLRATVDVGRAGLVDVYATHLGGAGNDPVDQAEEISSEIDEPDCATILMGDLETTPASEAHRVLTAAMTDSFEGNRFGAGLTAPNSKPVRRTGYVFHNPAATVSAAQVMPAGLSDQRAVRATIDFGKGGTCG